MTNKAIADFLGCRKDEIPYVLLKYGATHLVTKKRGQHDTKKDALRTYVLEHKRWPRQGDPRQGSVVPPAEKKLGSWRAMYLSPKSRYFDSSLREELDNFLYAALRCARKTLPRRCKPDLENPPSST